MAGSANTFRILDQAPQYLLDDGRVNAGGLMYTFETDLTTPKDTWSDPDQQTLNPNPIELDAFGRVPIDIWGDGAYGIEMQDALGATLWTRNDVQIPGGSGATIPALEMGQFLTNDGTNLVWSDIANQLVPDPTGLSNYVLASDGTSVPVWQQQVDPVVPDPEIVVTSTSFQAGVSTDTNKRFEQEGSSTADASGGKTTSKSITFDTAFSATPRIFVSITGSPPTSSGAIPKVYISAKSSVGFTVTFSTLTGGTSADSYTGSNITSAVAFDWHAVGNRTVTP